MNVNNHNTKRDKSFKRPRAIGFVRRVIPATPEKDGYGFIASNVFGLTNIDGRKEVDYYFKFSDWPIDSTLPQEGEVVVFDVVEYDADHRVARRIEHLTFSEMHLEVALKQSEKSQIISGVLHSSRKRYKANVLELVFQSGTQRIGKTNIIRRTILNHLRCVSNEHRDNICMSWFRNSNVAKQVRDALVDYQCANNRDAEIIRSMMRLFRVERTEQVVNAQESFLKAMHWLGSKKHELIVKLVRQQGELVVKEVRGPDFSEIKKYYIANPPDPEFPWQEGVLPIIGNWTQLGCNSEGYYAFGWKFTNLNRANILEIGVNTEKPIVRVNASDIIRCLYDAVAGSPGGAIEEMKNTYDMLGKQLAEAGDDVFIYELLQNANDYPHDDTVDVEIRIEDDCLTFSHTGEAFTARNVAAICTINYRDKSDNPNVIGYKGIGFKTVFRFNNKVIIRSGEFNFSFDQREEKIHDLPWMKTPVLEQTNGIVPSDYRVIFKLFPRDSDKLGRGAGSFENILKKTFEDERAVLFIPKLGKVRIVLPNEQWELNRNGNGWCQSTYEKDVSDEMRDRIDGQLDTDKENCRIPPKYRGMQKTSVSFACKLSGKRLVPEKDGILYCYLPARKSSWGFKFLMNTDMIPNGARSDIEYSIPLNKEFSRIAGEKFFEWIDSLIRSGQYEYDSIFALIPDFEECIKNRNEKVIEFIKEFQDGFESSLAELQIPSSEGNLILASSIVYDSTGILKELGESVWERLGYGRDIVVKSLRDSKDFDSFVKRYKTLLKIQEFGFDDLVKAVDNRSFQKWLENPNANQQFFKYLDGKGKIELFKSARIFLDDKRRLGVPKDMYYHADVEKYLKPFSDCFRFLPSSAPCHDKFKEEWFLEYSPKKLVCEILFSSDNEVRTRGRLKDVCIARMFFVFLARCKTSSNYNGRQRTQPVQESFTREFLEKLPAVLEGGEAVNAIASAEYSIFFLPEQATTQSIVANYRWINDGWARFLNDGYFDCEDRNTIREWLLKWELVREWNTSGVFTGIVDKDKFMDDIRKRMLDSRSDLGFYDFIFKCFDEKWIRFGSEWIRRRLSGWPVLDAHEEIVESSNKAIFYFNDSIFHWVTAGWLDDKVIVLNKKYSEQKRLFNDFGAREFAEEANFGEIFRTLLAPHLNLDSREKVIAFHRLMETKKKLLNDNQVAELKKTCILIRGDLNPVVGLDGVYLPTKFDVDRAIAPGVISDEIKVLDDVLCENGAAVEYWKWLGVKSLDEAEILKKRLDKYLERQNLFVENGESETDFKKYHKEFIWALASRDALKVLKENGYSDAIKAIRLFTKGDKLLLPWEMRLSNRYDTLCDFESFDKNGTYVNEMYCGVENISEFFKALGVKDKFSKEDVAMLANRDFCEYFWTKYLDKSNWDEIKDCLGANLPCVLDRTGVVRMPEELYHLDIEDYVLKLPDSESKLPMIEGIDKERLSELKMKADLTVEDSLTFLLADSECKMYNKRGRVLQWIRKWIEKNGPIPRALVDKYKNDNRAQWRNGQKKLAGIKELCAIRREKSGQVRLFANDAHVIDWTGLGIGGDCADDMRKGAECALSGLEVQLVDDTDVVIIPADAERVDDDVVSDIAVRLLVFFAERYPGEWGQEFDAMYVQLKELAFYKCSSLVVQCEKNEWLRAEHGKFLADGSNFYFVDDWQSKFVYGDMVAKLREKVCKKQYSLDDLKIALDTSGGDYQLAKRIARDEKGLLADEQFMQKLQELSSKVHNMVNEQLREKEGAPTPSTDTDRVNDGQDVVEDTQTPGEKMEQGEEPPKEPETKKNYSEEEQEQMFRIFGNGLTVEQMNDENRLVCIRLFNSLKAQGYEPRMLEADFVRDVYDNRRTFRASTIETNDGRQIHVISARKGVAYLPPKWWTRLEKPNNTKYVVCAVLNHLPDGFRYFRCRDDLLTAIGDNLCVIRVHGETAESRLDRTLRLFKFDPELSDFSIYSLLRVKATCDYDAAFREDMRFAESIGCEMGAEEEQDNDAY